MVRHSRNFDARTNRPDIGAGGGVCWVVDSTVLGVAGGKKLLGKVVGMKIRQSEVSRRRKRES